VGSDQQAIRELIAEWQRATAAGDVDSILPLMAPDVLFLTPGRAPFGRDAFDAGLRSMLQTHRIVSTGEVKEIEVSGDMAYCLSFLEVRVFSLSGGNPMERSGHVVSVLRKQPSGSWQIARDANMLVSSGDA